MTSSPVILLEFNEITPALIDQFIENGGLPNFDRFRRESFTFTTDADETQLEPWIQWVTVHSGLPYREHGVSRLDQGHKLTAPRLWDLVSSRGLASWVCGSMNVNYSDGSSAVVLPDPWCTQVKPKPSELEPYFRFVQAQVREHTKDSRGLSRGDYLRFATWMARTGLSSGTVLDVVKQLASERREDCSWKRVSLLDQIQYDVFRYYYRKLRPAFSTFFLNSTAHYQHAYWDVFEPGKYPNKTVNPKRKKFEHAIQYGYQKMDQLLGRFFQLAANDATLVLCSALSQQPSTAERARYRPIDFDQFLAFVGVSPTEVVPVMADQFYLSFASEELLEEAKVRLSAVVSEGVRVVNFRREGDRLFCGCKTNGKVSKDSLVSARESAMPFSRLFYEIPTGKVADHHPEGVFWIRRPDRVARHHEARVPLTSVAPSVLSLLGLEAPREMKGPVLIH
jgi:hypothetical protein